VARAARLGDTLLAGLEQLRRRYPGRIGALRGRGLVAGLQAVQPGGRTPDPDTALRINLTCFHKGLLMFAPVGGAGECIKIAPPLTIAEEALAEGIAVLAEAIAEVIGTE
jgi:4-aminobutyrate aminotransferase-like enzyme